MKLETAHATAHDRREWRCGVELKRSPRFGIAGSSPAVEWVNGVVARSSTVHEPADVLSDRTR